MPTTSDKNLELLRAELNFIRRHLALIEGAHSSDYETVGELDMAAVNALRALHEYELSIHEAQELPQAA